MVIEILSPSPYNGPNWTTAALVPSRKLVSSGYRSLLIFLIFCQIIPPSNMGRKFSAPGYLCPTLPTASNSSAASAAHHPPNPANPPASLGPRKGSLGPVAQGFAYASAPYSSATQWTGSTATCQVGLLGAGQPLAQYQPPATGAAPPPLHQGYHLGGAPPKAVGQTGSNLRPT